MKAGFLRTFRAMVLLICLVMIGAGQARAQQDQAAEPSSVADQTGAADLRRTLEYLTEIATRTRLNADDTPGMATVLYGRDLENRGIRTVAEAVSLVPGLRLALAGENVWRLVIRGAPRTFASGQVKILLDGTPLTTAFGVDPVPNMPIEQVDRIEVMRGPVSVIHGEFADAGVMNIITRRNGQRLYGGVGQHGVYTGGGVVSAEDDDADTRVSLNVAGQKADGAILYANTGISAALDGETTDDAPDGASSGDAGLFGESAAEPFDGKKSYYAGIAALQAGPLDFQAHGFVNQQPDFYDARLEGLRLRHRLESDRIRVNWGLGWQKNRFRSGNDFFDFSAPRQECRHGYDYDERHFQGQASATVEAGEIQTILLQGDFSRTDLDDVSRGDGIEEIRYGDEKRRLTSLTLQDEIRLRDSFILTLGLRYDHYDDIGDYTTPRLAAVWRLDPDDGPGGRHVLKAQIARSYRPPDFMDMLIAGEGGLSWDRDRTGQADTLELGYIYRSLRYLGRLTLFHSLIEPEEAWSVPGRKGGDICSSGAEAELEFSVIPEKMMFEGNVSLVTLENDLDRVNDWMTTLILTARPCRSLTFCLLYRFEDSWRFLEGTDPEGDASLDEVHRVDLTATFTPAGLRGMTLRAGVKNLTGKDIRYPWQGSYECYVPEEGAAVSGLREQRQTRWWWASVSFEF